MGKKVLIIDDDNRNIFALVATLKSKGYDCISATNAQQGIAFMNNANDIGIVLLDMMMPDMDGYEAIPAIRSRHQTPIIAVTAQAMTGTAKNAWRPGQMTI